MTSRALKVESLLKRELAMTLQRDLSDPRITGMISITRIKVTDDLKQAYVSISVMPKKNANKVFAALTEGTRHIQRQTQRRIALRMMPRLEFRLDDSLKKEAEVFAAIREAQQRSGLDEAHEPHEPQEDSR